MTAALPTRHSVRGFRSQPVPPATLDTLVTAAQQAPSWCNIQPWRVCLTMPPATAALATALQTAARSGFPTADMPFPIDYPEPYATHRKVCGGALYGAMGIAREDKASRYDAWLRNYALFDAPHLAVISCDRRLGPYALVDVGVWLGYFMAAAANLGIDTCALASVAAYPVVLRAHLPIADTDAILFGVALGYEDPTVPANTTRTTRAPVTANVTVVSALSSSRT